MHNQILFFFSSQFICVMVSNALWRVKFFENIGNWLLQNYMTVFLHRLTFDIFDFKPI